MDVLRLKTNAILNGLILYLTILLQYAVYGHMFLRGVWGDDLLFTENTSKKYAHCPGKNVNNYKFDIWYNISIKIIPSSLSFILLMVASFSYFKCT